MADTVAIDTTDQLDGSDQDSAPAPRAARWHRRAGAAGLVLAALVIFGAFTAVVFLNRAGGIMQHNWPVNFDLGVSDNSVLYQFASDVAHHRSLDWQFSPQVYVFPEIPISLASYVLGGGSVYAYFLWAAVLDNCAIFAAILGVARLVAPQRRLRDQVTLAFLAGSPLLILPLISYADVFYYQVGPTFYPGAYIFTIGLPGLLFARSRWVRIAIAVGYALTSASNPLLLAFSLPAAALMLLAVFLRDGWRPTVRPIAWLAATVIVGELIRDVLLSGLITLDPSAYVSIDRFASRLHELVTMFGYAFAAPADEVLLRVGFVALGLTVVVAVWTMRRYMIARSGRRPSRSTVDPQNGDHSMLTRLFLLLVPTTSVLALFCALVLHEFYIWLAAVGPMIFLLLLVGRRVARYGAALAVLLLAVLLLRPASFDRYGHLDRYFAYQPPITKCLDRVLPPGMTTGFSTLSDARPLSITADRPLVLAQILGTPGLGPNTWLANQAYFRHYRGAFFVFNPHGHETPIRPVWVEALFGKPQQVASCSGGAKVLIYTSKKSQARIHAYYQKF